jgi:hypothetical protein
MGYGLWVTGYGLWVMGYGLWVMGYGLRVTGYGSENRVKNSLKVSFYLRFFVRSLHDQKNRSHRIALRCNV